MTFRRHLKSFLYLSAHESNGNADQIELCPRGRQKPVRRSLFQHLVFNADQNDPGFREMDPADIRIDPDPRQCPNVTDLSLCRCHLSQPSLAKNHDKW